MQTPFFVTEYISQILLMLMYVLFLRIYSIGIVEKCTVVFENLIFD